MVGEQQTSQRQRAPMDVEGGMPGSRPLLTCGSQKRALLPSRKRHLS